MMDIKRIFEMHQFKDEYGVLALAGKKVTAAQDEETFEMDEFFGELEEVLHRMNSRLYSPSFLRDDIVHCFKP